MNDLACLMRAILADPEDDTVRLAYADCSDENGEHERAELIRLQVAAAVLPEGDPKRSSLESRGNALVASHGANWAPGFVGWGSRHVWFVRGFVEHASVTPTAFRRNWARLTRIAPLSAVDFYSIHRWGRLPPGWLRPALRTNAFSTVRKIDMYHRGVTDSHVRELLDSPNLGRVSGLGLSSRYLTRGLIRALAHSPRLTGLRELCLPVCGPDAVGDGGAAIIAGSEQVSTLTTLDLSHCGIGDRGALALAGSPYLGGLMELHLWDNDIGPRAAGALRQRFGNGLRLSSRG